MDVICGEIKYVCQRVRRSAFMMVVWIPNIIFVKENADEFVN